MWQLSCGKKIYFPTYEWSVYYMIWQYIWKYSEKYILFRFSSALSACLLFTQGTSFLLSAHTSPPVKQLKSGDISVKELPLVTSTAVIWALELDFVDTQSGERSISQDSVQFLQVVKEGVHQDECGPLETPLPFKTHSHLPNNKIFMRRNGGSGCSIWANGFGLDGG